MVLGFGGFDNLLLVPAGRCVRFVNFGVSGFDSFGNLVILGSEM